MSYWLKCGQISKLVLVPFELNMQQNHFCSMISLTMFADMSEHKDSISMCPKDSTLHFQIEGIRISPECKAQQMTWSIILNPSHCTVKQ